MLGLAGLPQFKPAGLSGLTQKGYGHVYRASTTADLTMSYANVDGGSAPAAGDLVIWIVTAFDSGGQPIQDLTGSGWTQYRAFDGTNAVGRTVLAKVLTAADISTPALVVDDPELGSIGFWVAYTVAGSVASLTIPTPNYEITNSTPSNQNVDSTALDAPQVAITFCQASGTDNSITLSISGATADIDFSTATDQWSIGHEDRYMIDATVGGVSITFSKSDDGNGNMLFSGYVAVG